MSTRRDILKAGLGIAALATGGLPLRAMAQTGPRLVTVGGSITEIVVALGHKDSIVGIDTTSQFPAEITHLPKVGYMRTLAAEGVMSLGPDQVLASSKSGPAAAVEQLQAAGLLNLIPDEPTVEGLQEKIRAVGLALGQMQEAEELARTVTGDLAAARKSIAVSGPRPRVGFLHNVGRSTPLAGGRNTPAQAMIGFAGGVNAFDQFEGHKPVSPEAVIEARPDAIIMTGDAIERFGGMDALVALPHLAGTAAGQNRNVVTIDALYTLGFGPRIAHAIVDLARAIHPDMQFADLPRRAWS